MVADDNMILKALDLCRPKARHYSRNYMIDADDLLQEFAVKLPTILSRVRPGSPWEPYVRRSFRNFFFGLARRKSVLKGRCTLDGIDVTVQHYCRDDSAAELIQLVSDQGTQAILKLMFVDGESTKCIASTMGCTVRTVQRKINDGISELRERLGEP